MFSFSIKDFPYSYENLVEAQSSPVKSHINKVSVSKVVSEELREKLNIPTNMPTFSDGQVDFYHEQVDFSMNKLTFP